MDNVSSIATSGDLGLEVVAGFDPAQALSIAVKNQRRCRIKLQAHLCTKTQQLPFGRACPKGDTHCFNIQLDLRKNYRFAGLTTGSGSITMDVGTIGTAPKRPNDKYK